METVPCALCGGSDAHELYPSTVDPAVDRVGAPPVEDTVRCTHEGYGRHHRIVRCRDCGLTYCSPRPSRTEVQAAYEAVEDPAYEHERRGRELTFDRHLDEMREILGPPAGRALLDVGAYTGVFVERANARGWDADGIEPSRWACSVARDRGLSVHPGALPGTNFGGRVFDCITAWDVIEHVCEPKQLLAACFDLVRPGGWLVVKTMDVGSLAARVLGSRWPWWMEMHLCYFSRATLARMVTAVGFEVHASRTESRYLTLRYLSSRLGAWSPLLRGMTRPLGWPPIGSMAVPVRFGDIFICYARKPELAPWI